MNTEQERAEFEAWCRSVSLPTDKDACGDYIYVGTHAPWLAWQARATLQSQDRTAWINTLERKAEALWTAAGEDRHEAMKDLLHHARIGVQSQERDDDPLQPAANWLIQAVESCTVADIQRGLNIGHNRAKRLFDHARRIEGGGE